MTERILYCKDICPLPKGSADQVKNFRTAFFLVKKVVKDGEEIGYTSVKSDKEIASNGLQVDDSSIACSDMKECFDFVLKESHGQTNGPLECKYTCKVSRASGISSQKSDQAPCSIEI